MFVESDINVFLSEDLKIETYTLEHSGKMLKIQSRKVHNGISRVVWNASLVMTQYIESARLLKGSQKGQDALRLIAAD